MPRVIEVIEVDETTGEGVHPSPVRRVPTYYTLDGEFLARNDALSYSLEDIGKAFTTNGGIAMNFQELMDKLKNSIKVI